MTPEKLKRGVDKAVDVLNQCSERGGGTVISEDDGLFSICLACLGEALVTTEAVSYRRGLEDAAKLLEQWPRNQNPGARAFAFEIRALAEETGRGE